MALAQIVGGVAVELQPNQQVPLPDNALASWATVMSWQEAARNALGVWTITEPTVPEGQVIASTGLTGTGPVARTTTFADAPVAERVLDWWKGRAILVLRGLDDDVQAAIDAIADATARKVAQAAFDGADFVRASPTLNAVLEAIGLSQADIDELFDDGEALTA